jgi:phage-related protein
LTLDTTGAIYAYITDVQAEESASLSEFMPSQDVTFSITGNTQFVVGDALEIDCERKTVRHWDSGAPQWENKIDVSNAQFFHLIPGKNLLAFSNELNANAQIFERHTERYLG